MPPTQEEIPSAKTHAGKSLRRALPWWAQLTILIAVFASGAIVGAMTAAKVIHGRMEYYRQHARVFPSDIVPGLRVQLQLDEKQAQQVYDILEQRHPIMIAARQRGAQAMLDEFAAIERDVAEVLNDWQRARWKAIAQSVRSHFLPPPPADA